MGKENLTPVQNYLWRRWKTAKISLFRDQRRSNLPWFIFLIFNKAQKAMDKINF